MKDCYVYILTNKHNHVLYVGVTNDLLRRVYQHRQGLTGGFTKKYNLHKLVHFERFQNPENAILREKQLKGWLRSKKNDLISQNNPAWDDLMVSLEPQRDSSVACAPSE